MEVMNEDVNMDKLKDLTEKIRKVLAEADVNVATADTALQNVVREIGNKQRELLQKFMKEEIEQKPVTVFLG